jgi:hypothetical protein
MQSEAVKKITNLKRTGLNSSNVNIATRKQHSQGEISGFVTQARQGHRISQKPHATSSHLMTKQQQVISPYQHNQHPSQSPDSHMIGAQ